MTELDVRRIGSDPDVFEVFYRGHVDKVQRFIARRVNDPYLAADLTAEVFLAAIASASSYRASAGTPTGWLYGVAHNVVAAERRRAGRELRAQSRIAGRRLIAGDDLTRIEERLDAESRARRLYEAMARLPASERSVLELTALDGLSVTEAAGALGIRPGAARVRLHRAREAMRGHLDDDADRVGADVTTPANPEAIR